MRQFSVRNLGIYVTAWAVFMAIPLAFNVVADKLPWGIRNFVAYAVLALFSMLTGGALGFAIGGRTWFWLSSCLTFVVILALLFYPAIIAAM